MFAVIIDNIDRNFTKLPKIARDSQYLLENLIFFDKLYMDINNFGHRTF